MLTEFGKEVQKLRIDRDVSATEMSEALKVKRNYCSCVEHGHTRPSAEYLAKTIKFFKLNKEEIDKLVNSLV